MELTVLHPSSRKLPLLLSVTVLVLAVFFLVSPWLDDADRDAFDRREFWEINGIVTSVFQEGEEWLITFRDGSSYAMLGLAKDILPFSELEAALPIDTEVTLALSNTTELENRVIGIRCGETVVLDTAVVFLIAGNSRVILYTLFYTLAAVAFSLAAMLFAVFMRTPKVSKVLNWGEATARCPGDEDIQKYYKPFLRRAKVKLFFTLYVPMLMIALSVVFLMFLSFLPAAALVPIVVFWTLLAAAMILLLVIWNYSSRAKKEIAYFAKYYSYSAGGTSGTEDPKNNLFKNHYYFCNYRFMPEGLSVVPDDDEDPPEPEFLRAVPYSDLKLKTRVYFSTAEYKIVVLLTTDCPEEAFDSGKEFIFFLTRDLFRWIKKYQVQVEGLDEALANIFDLAIKHITVRLQLKTFFGFLA
ncbi:MAG: hypothetical protein FWD58_10455 [Firmicutes bacterium]|nr:hypothetical protein [Bacillota bacterium]